MPARRHSCLTADGLQQILDLGRQGAETVDHLGRDRLDARLIRDIGKAAVKPEPHIEIGDISFGDQAPACRD